MAVTTGAHTVKFTAQGESSVRRTYISYMRWVEGANAGDKCIVTDTAGNIIFHSQADGENFIDILPVHKMVDGLKVLSLGSGIVYAGV